MKTVTLKLKSLDKITLNIYLLFIKKILLNISTKINSIYRLPITKRKITVLKSPHVHKKAMEQFELKIFSSVLSFDMFYVKLLLPYIYTNKPKNLKVSINYKIQ